MLGSLRLVMNKKFSFFLYSYGIYFFTNRKIYSLFIYSNDIQKGTFLVFYEFWGVE